MISVINRKPISEEIWDAGQRVRALLNAAGIEPIPTGVSMADGRIVITHVADECDRALCAATLSTDGRAIHAARAIAAWHEIIVLAARYNMAVDAGRESTKYMQRGKILAWCDAIAEIHGAMS